MIADLLVLCYNLGIAPTATTRSTEQEAVYQASRLIPCQQDACQGAAATAEGLPYRGNSFDVVVAFDVLDHVRDLSQTISEIARVLRPGGRFVYDTMNRTLLCRVIVIWIGEHLWRGGPPKGTHDWRKFVRPEDLVALLVSNGIKNIETMGFLPLGMDRRGRLASHKAFGEGTALLSADALLNLAIALLGAGSTIFGATTRSTWMPR